MPRSSSSSVCCSRKWCRSPDDDQADKDTWMEPCRSKKSKRRQIDHVEHAENDPSMPIERPLLGDNDSASELEESNNIDEGGLLQGDLMTTRQSTEHESSEEDRVSSSFSDATPQINNTTTENDETVSSTRWRYLFSFSSGRRPIIDAMDMLGRETVKGLKGTLPSPPRRILDDMKNKDAKSQTEDSSVRGKEGQPITLIVSLENGMFLTASKSDKYIQLWRVSENPATLLLFQKNDSEDINNDIDARNDIDKSVGGVEFIYDFKGHVSGVTALVKLDMRGRFLTASKDKTVKLWEIDCNSDGMAADRPHLLATFNHLDKRWIKVSFKE